ncbi:hypothetical protein CANTEDRAFT_126106 [Yamadazyma tenuis ATCC 10573]|uniref:C2H2-type domain-containing protein n=1 Tax=Candida tenuis (strain ATCC 10573 / BCRC 21748 / CBS 615 / JCM 9827 / NBRC 10315 / NRRL Y-1498 / VKM Y-70) TaxID=590646 RepID=G3B822_CANTC|nr:uncharacterized protein CANTEDRAFT_126106 [Yamadazyma tenuis ATCC 10573]EGV62334.1 hypothetical protein CANTEDRAFT_126106 [Yamadazyma tenuis ATCC 10573]
MQFFVKLSSPSMSNFGSKTPSGNARIFNCLKCNKAFTRDEHLTRHILSTHNKLKPFICGICSRPFSRRDLLLRHAKNLHQGSEKSINRLRKSKKRENSIGSTSSGSGDEEDEPSHHPTRSHATSPHDEASKKMSVSMLIT